jgi:carboxyl-terminal processing protease
MAMKVKLKLLRTIVVAIILLVMGGGLGYQAGKKDIKVQKQNNAYRLVTNIETPKDMSNVDFSLFWDVWKKLQSDYYDTSKFDSQKMVYGAIQGMVSSLGDPYTVFLPPTEEKRTEEDLSGSFGGVGIQLGYVDQQLAVMTPLKGMPAEKAGVKAGDLILHIKDTISKVDEDTQGMSLPKAVSLIRGPLGQPITLTLFRQENGGKPFTVELTRQEIVVPSVDLKIVDSPRGKGKIAHLQLQKFGGRTDEEWTQAVDQIVADKDIKGVVLDVRNNPGGYLNGAIFIASEFIDKGVIVQQQGKLNTETFSVNRKGRLTDMPVVVLMNRGSASASEIVAGALRDRLGAKLIGTKSFGKGTVQNAEQLRDGTGIHITIAKWLLPKGDWIHETGLKPDIEASEGAEPKPNEDPMLDAALKAL